MQSIFEYLQKIIFIYTDFIQGCERETGCQDLDQCMPDIYVQDLDQCMPDIDVQDLCSVYDFVQLINE